MTWILKKLRPAVYRTLDGAGRFVQVPRSVLRLIAAVDGPLQRREVAAYLAGCRGRRP